MNFKTTTCSDSCRYYYDKNIITKIPGCRYTYRFDFASLLAYGMGNSESRYKNYVWSALANTSVSYPSLALACQHPIYSGHPYQRTWTAIPAATYTYHTIPVGAVVRPSYTEITAPSSAAYITRVADGKVISFIFAVRLLLNFNL